jgi:hypothetical protein
MEGNEAQLVFEPNGVAWLERPDIVNLEQAEAALRRHAGPAEQDPA